MYLLDALAISNLPVKYPSLSIVLAVQVGPYHGLAKVKWSLCVIKHHI